MNSQREPPWVSAARHQNQKSDLIKSIRREDVEPSILSVTWDDGFELLGSFNWDGRTENCNIFYVPGAPPKWTPPQLPHSLQPDRGVSYIDENAFRMPSQQFGPALQATRFLSPTAKFNDLDVLINRKTLRRLLSFVSGSSTPAFQMDLHLVNDTTLIITGLLKGAQARVHADGKSCGKNFEDAFTTYGKGLEASSSHYRLIRYPMGHLHCAVQFEVDAYWEEAPEVHAGYVERIHNPGQNELRDHETTSDTSEQPPVVTRKLSNTTAIAFKGEKIPCPKLAELKTGSKAFTRVDSDTKEQMWLGRTPYLFTPRFDETDKKTVLETSLRNVGEEFGSWEDGKQESLKKLLSLFDELKSQTRWTRHKSAVLVHNKEAGELEMYEMENERTAVSEEMLQHFWGKS